MEVKPQKIYIRPYYNLIGAKKKWKKKKNTIMEMLLVIMD